MRLALVLAALGLWVPAGGAAPAPAAGSLPFENRSLQGANGAIDTVLAVRPGDVLAIDVGEGRLLLEGGADGRLAIEGGEGRRGVEVDHRGSRVTVRPRSADRELSGVLRFGVPRGMRVVISGQDLEVDLHGLASDVEVRVIEGDLRASDIDGEVELHTVDGEIDVADVRGSVTAETVDGEVRLRGVTGARVVAQALDGDLVLETIRSGVVSASTVDGDVTFVGEVPRGADLRFVTHDGDVVVVVPDGTSAEVEVATFAGEFMPEIPVRVGRIQAGRPLRFQMGAGGARIEMKAFDGDIVLRHGRTVREW